MEFLKELAEQMPDEILGYKTYMDLSEKTDNPEERQKLLNIAEQEKHHYITIKEILESYM